MASDMADRQTRGDTLPPSLADIDTLAQAAIERLPEMFRRHLADVLLRVEDFPDAEVMAEMGLRPSSTSSASIGDAMSG